jgi:GNAT superfamily N-acetyltransferase
VSEADPERLAAIHAAAFAGGEVWDGRALASVLGLAGAFAVERPGGMAIFRVVLDEAELLTIGVLPGNRRQGTGRALLAQGIADCIAGRGAAVPGGGGGQPTGAGALRKRRIRARWPEAEILCQRSGRGPHGPLLSVTFRACAKHANAWRRWPGLGQSPAPS